MQRPVRRRRVVAEGPYGVQRQRQVDAIYDIQMLFHLSIRSEKVQVTLGGRIREPHNYFDRGRAGRARQNPTQLRAGTRELRAHDQRHCQQFFQCSVSINLKADALAVIIKGRHASR